MPQFKHFCLPDVGEGLTEAEILGWRVQSGDAVSVNQILVEIETAKAAVELPCPYEGVVGDLLVEQGATVEVGAPIVSIDLDPAGSGDSSADAGEDVANLVGYGPRESSAKRRRRKHVPTAEAGEESSTISESAPAVNGAVSTGPASTGPASTGSGSIGSGSIEAGSTDGTAVANGSAGTGAATGERTGGRVPLAKPPVRKLAKDLDVDLRALSGSGSDGVITRADVEQAATGGTAEPAASPGTRERRVPIKGVRKATAEAMVDSAFTAPHVTEFLTVDVTPMMEFRERLRQHPDFSEVKLTPLAFAAKALCMAVRRTPDVNAAWDGQAGEIVYKDYVHLGVAAATPRGLIVPKVRDADGMSLPELASSLESLTWTAREGKTTPADMAHGTITITNVGVFGVDTGTPILTPGESAILAFGAIREMPWVVDGQVVPRQVCQLALSFDHRVVDGQQGSRFLADVGALLAEPGMAMTY